jgi:hypothetical protein
MTRAALAWACGLAALGCTAQVISDERKAPDAGPGDASEEVASPDAGTRPDAADGPTWDATADVTSSPDSTDAADAASMEAGGTSCPGLFCEDFERGSLDTTVWSRTSVSPGNDISVQGANVAHGAWAARFHALSGTSLAMIFADHLPAALEKHYFGRMYYYATGFPSESGGHSAYVTASNGATGFPYHDHHLEVGSYLDAKGPIWQLTYWTGDGPEYIGAGGAIPKGKWFCLEWEFDDSPDQIAVWVDGDGTKQGYAFRNIHDGSTDLVGKLTTLGLGFRTWHPMGAPDIDIFLDDIVLDVRRVGCLP